MSDEASHEETETILDIAEELATTLGLFGHCCSDLYQPGQCTCRGCFVEYLTARIRKAAKNERRRKRKNQEKGTDDA